MSNVPLGRGVTGDVLVKKVLLLTSSLVGGGAERVIANLAEHLDPGRFSVTVAHLKERGGVGDELLARGFDVVGIPRLTSRPGRYLSFTALRRVARDRGVHLIHSHTTYSLVDAVLCRRLTSSGLRVVHTFHFGNYPNLPRRYREMERIASRGADHLVAVGQEQAGALRSLYGIPDRRLTIILNGVTCSAPRPDPEWAARLERADRIVIGTTATLIEQKGLDYLLQVADLLRCRGVPCVFVVTGDGPLRTVLEAQCRAMGLDDVVLFAGWKQSAGVTMTPLYDVLFQPSRWEAMSVVVLEAMGAGKPVVAADVGDNRHVVRDGVTGYIVPVGDIGAMAERLAILAASKDLRRSFGTAGRRDYESRFTARAMVQGYERLYDHVLTD